MYMRPLSGERGGPGGITYLHTLVIFLKTSTVVLQYSYTVVNR